MPLSYCSVHHRFLHPHTHTWMSWEQAQEALTQQGCPKHAAAPRDMRRVATACDRCLALTQRSLGALIAPRS